MSSAFLKGMLHGQAGCKNPLWENEQSWTSSTKVLWEGVRRRAGEMGNGPLDSDTVFVAFQPWSFRAWTGAVPSSGPSRDRAVALAGVKNAGLSSSCPQKEQETLPKEQKTLPKEWGALPKEQELWEAGGAS